MSERMLIFLLSGGTEAIETGMQNYLTASPVDAERDLTEALRLGLEAWAIGSELSSREPENTDPEDTQIDTQQMHEIISEATEDGEIEAGSLGNHNNTERANSDS